MKDNYFSQQEWLMKRLGRFTSSEIHKLFQGGRKKTDFFGQGALTYIRTKAAELLTMEVKEEIDFKQAEWGKANEGDAFRAYEKQTGLLGEYYGISDPQFFPYGDYAGGSPDWEKGIQKGTDFKCPFNTAEHIKNLLLTSVEEYKEERWEYYCQGQMNMKIRGWESFDFVSYDPRMVEPKYRLKILTMYPDSEWLIEFDQRLAAGIEEMDRIVGTLEGRLLIASSGNGASDHSNDLKI